MYSTASLSPLNMRCSIQYSTWARRCCQRKHLLSWHGYLSQALFDGFRTISQGKPPIHHIPSCVLFHPRRPSSYRWMVRRHQISVPRGARTWSRFHRSRYLAHPKTNPLSRKIELIVILDKQNQNQVDEWFNLVRVRISQWKLLSRLMMQLKRTPPHGLELEALGNELANLSSADQFNAVVSEEFTQKRLGGRTMESSELGGRRAAPVGLCQFHWLHLCHINHCEAFGTHCCCRHPTSRRYHETHCCC